MVGKSPADLLQGSRINGSVVSGGCRFLILVWSGLVYFEFSYGNSFRVLLKLRPTCRGWRQPHSACYGGWLSQFLFDEHLFNKHVKLR